ncbi:MAG: alpha-1,2-fucosyltransferase [Muribaculaceae bacterium]
MKIIKINGHFTRQMFQYALYLRLRQMGQEVALHTPKHWIDEQFDLADCVHASAQQLQPYVQSIGTNLKRLVGIKAATGHIITDSFGEYNNEVITHQGDAYCNGWWASPRYFEPVAPDVQKAFTLPADQLSSDARNALHLLGEGETAALHIHMPTSPQNTCTTDYYNWAIANLQAYVPEARIVVFTDSQELAKQHLMLPADTRFVQSNRLQEHELMQVMLRASHNICANTLTSWWAAWLNSNPDKISIVPQRWLAGSSTQPRDLTPIYWTAIPVT